MNFTEEDYESLYIARYSVVMANKTEDTKSIIRGTFVEIFQDYDFSDVICCLAFPLDLLFRYLPLVIERLRVNLNKPVFKPEESIKLDNNTNLGINAARREHYDSLNDLYNVNREEKINKAEAINNLRKHLFINKLVLKGTYKNLKITFGNEIDGLLKKVITNYSNIKSLDVLENKLKEIYQQDIKVVII